MIEIDHSTSNTWEVRPPAPPLLPVFRSRLVGDLLSLTLLDPDRTWRTSELVDRTGAPYPSVTRELRRLGQAAILAGESAGRTRLWKANRENPYYMPLRDLVAASFGPTQVVAEEFSTVEGAEVVLIYGSWAARSSGDPGPPPRDIDVLVVGTASRTAAYEAAQRAQERLGREVNATVRRADEWEAATDGFAQHVKASPTVQVLPTKQPGGSTR